MKNWKILNYPQDVESCHRLIDTLLAELNDYASFIMMDAENEQACEPSIPLADDKKSSQIFTEIPKGLNGGVGFGEEMGHRPPLAHGNKLRGS